MFVSPDEYIKQRVDDQISWYDRKSLSAQRWFKRLRGAEIICAAAIPVLAGFSGFHFPTSPIMGILGAAVVIIAAFVSLNQYQEKWIQYRTICESLRHEKYLFLTHTEPYDADNPFPLFVQRIESLISKENTAWSQYSRTGAEAAKPSQEKR